MRRLLLLAGRLTLIAQIWAPRPVAAAPPFTLESVLAPRPDGDPAFSSCGGSVAIADDYAVVGCPEYQAGIGAVFFYRKEGGAWTLDARGVGSFESQLGFSVAAWGNTVAVGAPRGTSAGPNSGLRRGYVEIWERISGEGGRLYWVGRASLYPDPGASAQYDRFGATLALGPDTLVIGSPQSDGESAADRGSAFVYVRGTASWDHQQTLLASDPQAGANFGAAVSLSGSRVLIGAPGHGGPLGAGAAYLFELSGATWTEQQQLNASEAASQDRFGASLLLAGETALVGAPGDDHGAGTDAGSIYAYRLSAGTWLETQRISPPQGSTGDQFGASIAASGDLMVGGAPYADLPGAPDAGAAASFTFASGSWSHQRRLDPSTPRVSAHFGTALAIATTLVLVGAPDDEQQPASLDSGSATVFEITQATTSVLAGLGFDIVDGQFGSAVATSGNLAVVGAYADEYPGGIAGSATVFERVAGVWTYRQKLFSPHLPTELDSFGSKVAISDEALVVAAPNHGHPWISRAGAAFVYRRDGASWSLDQELMADEPTEHEFFGSSLALEHDTLAIGSPYDDRADGDDQYGSVFVFRRNATSQLWVLEAKLTIPGFVGTYLGRYIALSGDTLLAASDHAIHFFERVSGVWALRSTFNRPTYFNDLSTAMSVSLQGDTGLMGLSGAATGTGLAFVYSRSAGVWALDQEIPSPTGTPYAMFGASVALLDGTLAISSPHEDFWRGTVYVYDRSGSAWLLRQRIAGAPMPASFFGTSLALSNHRLLIGEPSASIYTDLQGGFYSITPCRLADTRVTGQGPALVHGVSRSFGAIGSCGIPATAKSLVLNVTVTQPTGTGYVVLYAANTPVPGTSTVSFSTGQTRANNATVAIGSDGTGDFRVRPNLTGSGTVHVILDVVGYFE